MPSHLHEAIARLILDVPSLALDLLSDQLGVPIPPGASLEATEANLTEATPATFQADRIVLQRDAAGDPNFVVVVEVQLQPDDEKEWTWLAYLALARRQHRCPGAVLIIALSDSVAAHARRPIQIDPAHTWAPFVAGPASIPRVVDPDVVRRHPELGVLSALAHRKSAEDIPVLRAVFAGLNSSALNPKVVEYLWDLIEAGMGPTPRSRLEQIMEVPAGYSYQGPFARKYYGQGLENGRVEGQRTSLSFALETVLKSRGFVLTAEQHARIAASEDVKLLEGWIARAAIVGSVDELLG